MAQTTLNHARVACEFCGSRWYCSPFRGSHPQNLYWVWVGISSQTYRWKSNLNVRGQNPKHPILIPLAEWRPSYVPGFPPTPDAHQSPLSDSQPLKPIHLSGMAPATRASRWLATRRGRVPGVRARPRVEEVNEKRVADECGTTKLRIIWHGELNKASVSLTSLINLVAESRLH